jgi:hypothetical protein
MRNNDPEMIDQPSNIELPKRRRFQFGLRTLMIVVALAAVANSVFVDRLRLAAERDHALRQLQVPAWPISPLPAAASSSACGR